MNWNYTILTNVLVVVLMLLVLYFKNYLRAVYLAFKLPGPPAVPILGNVLYVRDSKKLEEIGNNCGTLYGPVMRIWISIVPFFLLVEPKYLQIVLSTNKNNTKNMFYRFLHNFIGDGLITNTGEKWKQHRKLIQPYFNINILKVYFDAFHSSSNVFLQTLENKTDINVIKLANWFVLDVLQATILGIPVQKSSPYRNGKLFMPYRLTRPWLLLDAIFKQTDFSKKEAEQQLLLRTYTKKILDAKKANCLNNPSPLNNLIEMMIEISKENPEFSEDDIINEACTFMLAGQDSVGAALTFSLYFLAKHEEIQQKVLDEIESIVKSKDSVLTYEDISEMKYLEQCIKETLRLCPSVPIFARKLTEDVTLGKNILPSGTNVLICPFATHRLSYIFPDPLKFDPDRFLPENKSKIHPYGYLPFSLGPRNCIGYKFALIELKTVLCQVLRHYQLSLTPGHEELNLSYRITLKAKNGIWLRLKKRL